MGRSLEARFWAKVTKGADSECWEWGAARQPKGYGAFRVMGRTHLAHRIAWVLVNGPIPDGHHVCHHCDNPSCCNLAHLFLGTNADNVADREAKGRGNRGRRYKALGDQARANKARGDQNGQAKLKERQIPYIRALLNSGVSMSAISLAYEVNRKTISDIASGKTWVGYTVGLPNGGDYDGA